MSGRSRSAVTATCGIDPDRPWRGWGAVLRLAAALEGLNDDHAATTARARTWQDVLLIGRCGIGCLGILRARRCGEQLAGAFDVGSAVGTGEQSVVADAVQ